MKMKKMLSALCALAMSVSAFAGLTVSAAEGDVTYNILYGKPVYENDIITSIAPQTDFGEDPNAVTLEAALQDANGANCTAAMPIEGSVLNGAKGISKKFDTPITSGKVYYTANYTNLGGNNQLIKIVDSNNNAIYASTADQKLNGETVVATICGTEVKNWVRQGRTCHYGVKELCIDLDAKKVSYTLLVSSGNNSYSTVTGTVALTSNDVAGLVTTSNKSYNYYIDNVSLYNVVEPVAKALCTIEYKYDGNTIKTDSYAAQIGSVPTADTTAFWMNNTKYFCISDDAADLTVAEDGSTVVTVMCRQAESFDAKLISSIDQSVIASDIGVEGENVTLYYPRYTVIDGDAYMAGSEDGSNRSGYTRTLTYDEPAKTIEYTKTYQNVIYFSEAEDVTTMTASDDTARCSNGKGAYTEVNSKITTLPAGKYQIITGHRADAETVNFNAGTTTVYSVESHGYWGETISDEFVINEDTDISVAAFGNKNKLLDYILIIKTGDITPDITTTVSDIAYTEGDDGSHSAYCTITVISNGSAISAIEYNVTSEGYNPVTATWHVPDGVTIGGDVKAGLIVNGLGADETVTVNASAK